MTALLLFAPALALALLAAQFHRAGAWPLTLASVVLIALLALPRAWVARLLQLCLVLGAAEWVRTAVVHVHQRLTFSQPWTRLAIFLGAVALFTAACALVFERKPLRTRFRLA
jgi:hypothetical protein